MNRCASPHAGSPSCSRSLSFPPFALRGAAHKDSLSCPTNFPAQVPRPPSFPAPATLPSGLRAPAQTPSRLRGLASVSGARGEGQCSAQCLQADVRPSEPAHTRRSARGRSCGTSGWASASLRLHRHRGRCWSSLRMVCLWSKYPRRGLERAKAQRGVVPRAYRTSIRRALNLCWIRPKKTCPWRLTMPRCRRSGSQSTPEQSDSAATLVCADKQGTCSGAL